MSEASEEIKSEFDQKLRESMAENHNTDEYQNQDADKLLQPEDKAGHSEMIPVIEEQIHIDKKEVETGSVHLSKKVYEEEVTVDTTAVREEIDVERVAINKQVESAPEIRYEGDTTIIPVMREEAVVVKRLVLVEELHVTKRIVRTHEPQQVTLRKEEININREISENDSPV